MNENTLAHDLQNVRPVDLARERVEALVKAANEWIAKVPEILDEETAARAQTYIEQLDAELSPTKGKLILDEKAELEPLREQVTEIRERYIPLKLLLVTCKELLVPKRKAWLDRKQRALDAEKRKQQEEALRLQQQALAAQAKARSVEQLARAKELQKQALESADLAARPPLRAQVRNLFGGRAASVRKVWRAEIIDQLQVYLLFADHPDVVILLQRLVNAAAPAAHREGREIPGARLVEREA